MSTVTALQSRDTANRVEYVHPGGEKRSVRTYRLGLPAGVVPKRVGMLANGFPDADKFLARQAEALKALWPDATFTIEVKASASQLNIGIRPELLEKMAEASDVVVIAWGHCGSCTSGVTRDAIAFENRGIPTVTLICDVFWEYSKWMGEAMGLKDIPKVMVPFPLSGIGADGQDRCAREIAPEIVSLMTVH